MGLVWIIYGGVVVVLIFFIGFYIIQTLVAIRRLLNKADEVLGHLDKQIDRILQNVATTTDNINSTTSRVEDVIGTIFSLPHTATQVGKEILSTLFGRKKRDGTP